MGLNRVMMWLELKDIYLCWQISCWIFKCKRNGFEFLCIRKSQSRLRRFRCRIQRIKTSINHRRRRYRNIWDSEDRGFLARVVFILFFLLPLPNRSKLILCGTYFDTYIRAAICPLRSIVSGFSLLSDKRNSIWLIQVALLCTELLSLTAHRFQYELFSTRLWFGRDWISKLNLSIIILSAYSQSINIFLSL